MPIDIGDELSALDGLSREDVLELDKATLLMRYSDLVSVRDKLTGELWWIQEILEAKRAEEAKKVGKRKLEEAETQEAKEEEEKTEEVEEVD